VQKLAIKTTTFALMTSLRMVKPSLPFSSPLPAPEAQRSRTEYDLRRTLKHY
jgi:hypothetical protein